MLNMRGLKKSPNLAVRLLGRMASPIALQAIQWRGRIRPTVRPRIIVFRNNTVLLVQDWVNPKRWELPGGAKKRGETSKQAVIRELFEETGVKTQVNRVSYVQTYYGRYEAPIYRTNVVSENIEVQSNEIIAADWWPIDKLPDNISPIVRIALQNLPKSP